MAIGLSLCDFCKHFKGPGCKAFAENIPDEIYWGVRDHRLPFEGDGGVQFELEGEADELFNKHFGPDGYNPPPSENSPPPV